METKGLRSMIGYFDTAGKIIWGFKQVFTGKDLEKQNYLWLQHILENTPLALGVQNIGLTITGAEGKYLRTGYKLAKVNNT